MSNKPFVSVLAPYLQADAQPTVHDDYLEFSIANSTEGLQANAFYFNNEAWAEEYLIYCHRSESFKNRWMAAIGDLTGKVVIDIGCGPGNIAAALGCRPKLLIGIDVAPTSLRFASTFGYLPVLADATSLPFKSTFADVVMLNATLHHCDDMEAVLCEAARLVKPGGLLVTDHDPQRSAWQYTGIARLLWDGRLWLYRIIEHGFHKSAGQQQAALASEIHHKPGHGVTREFFVKNLAPLGFDVNVYPHNHALGAEVLAGQKGAAELKYRLGNWLSGRHPEADGSALSLMCVARRSN